MVYKIVNAVKNFFLTLYKKLVRINDSPQRVALGFGLGIFSGIFPGTGPLAALFLALIFKANKASALLGSLLTNTWLSFVILLPAVKVGSYIAGMNWEQAYQGISNLSKAGGWKAIFHLPFLQVILPLIIGYILVALCLGALTYICSLTLIKIRNNSIRK